MIRRLALVTMLAAGLLGAVGGPANGTEQTAAAPTCQRHELPISVRAGAPATQRVTGRLCAIGRPAGKPVQLLVHGYTLDHRYWDPAYQPQRYSYVRAMTRAGYATFSFDRLGAGASSRPAATDLTIDNHAFTVHQLIRALRTGKIGGTRFGTVVLVGHSLGAATAQTAASKYRDDADAVILSDWLHTPLWIGTPGVVLTSLPVLLDPRFTDLPLGYVAPLPGTHRSLFFHSANADERLIALDEQRTQAGSLFEEITIVPTVLPALTKRITAPVLLATGEHDSIFCGPLTPCPDAATVRAREAPFFSSAARFDTYVQPDTGHLANLHRNAPDFFAAAKRWLDSVPGVAPR